MSLMNSFTFLIYLYPSPQIRMADFLAFPIYYFRVRVFFILKRGEGGTSIETRDTQEEQQKRLNVQSS